jgi:transcription elongation factor GreA
MGGSVVVNQQDVLLSEEGLNKLERELEHLETVRRKEVAERIKQARGFGDLAENSEYEEAKNEQAFVEGRIRSLRNLLRKAVVVDDEELDPDVVNIGSRVTLQDEETGDTFEYTIVGSTEAEPTNFKISYKSPVGAAVFGKNAGEVVRVKLPAGEVKYRIVAVER